MLPGILSRTLYRFAGLSIAVKFLIRGLILEFSMHLSLGWPGCPWDINRHNGIQPGQARIIGYNAALKNVIVIKLMKP